MAKRQRDADTHFASWRSAVDDIMKRQYAITATEDAGLDDQELRKYWESRQSPTEFVDWFGEKYDLIPVSSWSWQISRSKL